MIRRNDPPSKVSSSALPWWSRSAHFGRDRPILSAGGPGRSYADAEGEPVMKRQRQQSDPMNVVLGCIAIFIMAIS
jgi:hypothetical protein